MHTDRICFGAGVSGMDAVGKLKIGCSLNLLLAETLLTFIFFVLCFCETYNQPSIYVVQASHWTLYTSTDVFRYRL
jgi:hypothetical protein